MNLNAVAINSRFKLAKVTGVQRYAWEVSRRLSIPTTDLSPKVQLSAIRGHAWEQVLLPTLLGGRLLWSPANTGPLLVGKQVVTIHDLAAVEHPEWFSGRFSQWYRWLLPKLGQRVQHILTVSEFTKSRLISVLGISPTKITVTPLSADNSLFFPKDANLIAEIRRKYNISTSPYFAVLGSLEPRKNLGNVVAAWKKVSAELSPDAQLVIIGGKGKTDVFASQQASETIPNVIQTGYVPDGDIPALLSGAAGFLYMSLYEGFGLPVAEAMACGTPVITSNVTSIPEVCGRAAILTDPSSVEGIAKSIHLVATDTALSTHLRTSGLERMKGFSWDRCARETEAVLMKQALLS